MEMRPHQRAVAGGGAALWVHLRRHLPSGGRLQGSQPRYRVVRDHRPAMAALARRVPAVARAGQFRRDGAAAAAARGVHRGHARGVADSVERADRVTPTRAGCVAATLGILLRPRSSVFTPTPIERFYSDPDFRRSRVFTPTPSSRYSDPDFRCGPPARATRRRSVPAWRCRCH
jgi:hypothetical protein